MEELLKQILQRLDKMESNVEKVAMEVARMHERVQEVEKRTLPISLIEVKVDTSLQKLDGLNDRADTADRKFEELDRKLTAVVNHVENLDGSTHARLRKLETAPPPAVMDSATDERLSRLEAMCEERFVRLETAVAAYEKRAPKDKKKSK
jgi:hypothetical protein